MCFVNYFKLSKSSTLRITIDHINDLRTRNAELLRENESLKRALGASRIPVSVVSASCSDLLVPKNEVIALNKEIK